MSTCPHGAIWIACQPCQDEDRARAASLSASINRLIDEKADARAKLGTTCAALRLIAATTADIEAKATALAALEVVGSP